MTRISFACTLAMLVFLSMVSLPAHAILGVGDVVFDPTNYASISEQLTQMKKLYDTATEQLGKLQKVQTTLDNAYQSYERLRNLNLHALASDFKPGAYFSRASSADKIGAVRGELTRLTSNGTRDTQYIKGQLGRLANLETLVKTRDEMATSVQTASSDQDVRAASQTTAQNTATLAMLAALEAERREQADLASEAANKAQTDLLSGSADIYQAMGRKAGAAP